MFEKAHEFAFLLLSALTVALGSHFKRAVFRNLACPLQKMVPLKLA